jgi:hypothetical protein
MRVLLDECVNPRVKAAFKGHQVMKLGFLVIKVPDNKIKFYEPIFAAMCAAAERMVAGQVVHITSPAAN